MKIKDRKISRMKMFTLMEIVVVIVILMMLAAIATPLYFRHVKKARITTAKTQIKMIEQAIFDFRLDMGALPDSSSGLRALVENTTGEKKWDGPYIKPFPKDPWGREYIYVYPGQHGDFDIICYGGDGESGGEGEAADINNWE
ncbi:MAG: type II secretion system major pseudopilin GspG [Victivallaceae bacterium]